MEKKSLINIKTCVNCVLVIFLVTKHNIQYPEFKGNALIYFTVLKNSIHAQLGLKQNFMVEE